MKFVDATPALADSRLRHGIVIAASYLATSARERRADPKLIQRLLRTRLLAQASQQN